MSAPKAKLKVDPYMNGYRLLEWLQGIPMEDLKKCQVWLEVHSTDNERLVTAKVYDQNQDGKLDTIYLIHK